MFETAAKEIPDELKGIFVWDPKIGRMFVTSNYTNKPLLFYRLPLNVFTDDFGDQKYGYALFESEESWNKEADCSQFKIAGMNAYESFKFLNRRAIFLNRITREIDKSYIWLKTQYGEKKVFLLDDAYMDKSTGIIKCRNSDGLEVSLCGIPFCEYAPTLHMLDNGDYDYKDIRRWPLVTISPIMFSGREE